MIRKKIPAEYVHTEAEDFEFYHHEFESKKNIEFLENCIFVALEETKKMLGYKPNRALIFCAFRSVRDYQKTFGKTVPNNMLTLAYCDNNFSLVTLFSPVTNLQNADKKRMIRHLAHEITHAFIYEKTESVFYPTKRINVENWVDEGFAEIVASKVCGKPEIIKDYLFTAEKHKTIEPKKLNEYLDDFDSPMRQIAFACSAKLVFDEIGLRELCTYFRNL